MEVELPQCPPCIPAAYIARQRGTPPYKRRHSPEPGIGIKLDDDLEAFQFVTLGVLLQFCSHLVFRQVINGAASHEDGMALALAFQ